MREPGHKLSRKSDNYVDGILYSDTSKNRSSQANYAGSRPNLDTSEDPSKRSNYAGGSPYLDKDSHPEEMNLKGGYV
jgi:hypothetical protein